TGFGVIGVGPSAVVAASVVLGAGAAPAGAATSPVATSAAAANAAAAALGLRRRAALAGCRLRRGFMELPRPGRSRAVRWTLSNRWSVFVRYCMNLRDSTSNHAPSIMYHLPSRKTLSLDNTSDLCKIRRDTRLVRS